MWRKCFIKLLALYPSSYRQDYAEPMLQHYDDMVQDAVGADKNKVSQRIIVDLILTAVCERYQELQHQPAIHRRHPRMTAVTAAGLLVSGVLIIYQISTPAYIGPAVTASQAVGNEAREAIEFEVGQMQRTVPAGTTINVNITGYIGHAARGRVSYESPYPYPSAEFVAVKLDGQADKTTVADGTVRYGWEVIAYTKTDNNHLILPSRTEGQHYHLPQGWYSN